MENTIIINCPKCSKQIMIPTGTAIKYRCPLCKNEFEYDWRNKDAKNKKTDYSWIIGFVILVLAIYGGYELLFDKKEPEKEIVKIKKENNNLSDKSKEDSIFTATLQSILNKEKNNSSEKITKGSTDDDILNSLIKAIDIDSDITNDLAVRLASIDNEEKGPFNIYQICSIYDFLVANWKYVSHPVTKNVFRSASRIIKNNLAGDCTNFAIIMAAEIESIGGYARISLAYPDQGEGHAFTEVCATENKKDFQKIVNKLCKIYSVDTIHSTHSLDGKVWLNLDWWGNPKHPGGAYYKYIKRTIYYPSADKPYYEKENY